MIVTKSITYRQLIPERDAQAVAGLYTQHERVENSAETLLDGWRRHMTNGRYARYVAEVGGHVIGFGRAVNTDYDKPGVFLTLAVVEAQYRRLGIGSRLSAMLQDFAREHGAHKCITEVREDEPESQDFARRRGFEIEHHFFESTLDSQAFSSEPYAALMKVLCHMGIEFSSVGAQGGGDDALRKLHEITRIADEDAPGDLEPNWSFEQFKESFCGAKWFDPFGNIVAIFDGEYVGLSAVGETSPCDFYTLNTGVRRDWRGKGLATALKSLAIEHAKAKGGTVIRTHNHSDNAAMLAINRKLGFKPEPGWYYMTKELTK